MWACELLLDPISFLKLFSFQLSRHTSCPNVWMNFEPRDFIPICTRATCADLNCPDHGGKMMSWADSRNYLVARWSQRAIKPLGSRDSLSPGEIFTPDRYRYNRPINHPERHKGSLVGRRSTVAHFLRKWLIFRLWALSHDQLRFQKRKISLRVPNFAIIRFPRA